MAAVLVFPFHGDMVSSGFFGQFVQLLVDFIPFLVDRIDTPPLVYIPLGYGIGRFLDGRFPCFRVDPGPLGPVGKLLGNVLGFFHPLVCFHIETSAPELVGDHARLAVYRIPIFFAVIGVRLKPVGFLERHGFALPYLQLFFRVVFIVDPFPLLPGIQTGWHAASRDNVVVLDKGVAYRAVDSLVNLPVRVLGREEPFVDAGVEAEDGGLVVAESVETDGGFLSLADGLPAVGERVLALVDLHGRAAAPPSVGREIGSPERVVGGEGDAVQCGVFLADAVVTSGAVLEVVAVLLRLEVLPLGGHLGGGDGEIVFGAQVVAVVGAVYLEDIPLELIRHVCYHGNFASGLGMVFSQCRRGQDGTKIKKALGSVRKLYLPLNAF